MSELPQGWAECCLGDVIKIQNGYAFPSKEFQEDGVPVIRQSNLAGDRVLIEGCVYLDKKWLDARPDFILRKDDVLIGMSGSVGKLCIYNLDRPALQNQRTGRIVPLSGVHVEWRFIWEYLNTIEQLLLKKGKGMGVLNVSASDIESLPFRLAPLPEQRRIVAKLEQVLARVDACRSRLEQVPTLLKHYRQSVLAAACSGRMTEDWREEQRTEIAVFDLVRIGLEERLSATRTDSELRKIHDIIAYGGEEALDIPDNWSTVALEKVALSFDYGTSARSSESGKIPVLRMGNLQRGEVDWSDLAYTSDEHEISKYLMKPNTVLFNRTNSPELVGKTSIYRGEQPAIFAGYLIRINHIEALVVPEYLNFCLNTIRAREYCRSVKSDGVSQSNINAKKLAKFDIPLPPLSEQQEIVRRVTALFTLADQVEARYAQAKTHVDRLTQSILAKAFRGELVPQDPADEPAAVLLTRIQAARGTGKPTRSGRRGRVE